MYSFFLIILQFLYAFISRVKSQFKINSNVELEIPAKEQKPVKKYIPYENKYLDLWNNRNKEIVCEGEQVEKLKNSFLLENCPNGNVCMYYNNDSQAFEFYSDKTIPYGYLETIGRRYVLMFQCQNLFVDMKEEIDKAIEEKKKSDEEKKKNSEQKKTNNVFANFKEYNSSLKKTSTNPTIQTKGRQDQAIKIPKSMEQKFKSAVQEQNLSVLVENTNKYIYKGNMINFQFLKKPEKKKETLSFKDFMKLKKK